MQKQELPLFIVSRLTAEAQQPPECSICLETVNDTSTAFITAHCYHIFHIECAKSWKNSYCAVCRTETAPKNSTSTGNAPPQTVIRSNMVNETRRRRPTDRVIRSQYPPRLDTVKAFQSDIIDWPTAKNYESLDGVTRILLKTPIAFTLDNITRSSLKSTNIGGTELVRKYLVLHLTSTVALQPEHELVEKIKGIENTIYDSIMVNPVFSGVKRTSTISNSGNMAVSWHNFSSDFKVFLKSTGEKMENIYNRYWNIAPNHRITFNAIKIIWGKRMEDIKINLDSKSPTDIFVSII